MFVAGSLQSLKPHLGGVLSSPMPRKPAKNCGAVWWQIGGTIIDNKRENASTAERQRPPE